MLRRPQKGVRDDFRGESINLAQESGAHYRWNVALTAFMRVLALGWMVLGLLEWWKILAPGKIPLDAMPMALAVAIVFFAVADLLAAVGLWMATAWGGVLWLFSACAAIIVSLFMPGFRFDGMVALTVNLLLIMIYFILSWQAALERDN